MKKTAKKKQTITPTLRFSPTAWAKLLFLRDLGKTEVGGFGIAPNDDPLFVQDIQIVRQTCSWTHVSMDDAAVADFFDRQVDEGRRPDRFARIWIHTHPGDCPHPSGTDEETFQRVFGRADWAVMFILAREGESYARLRVNTGLPLEIEIPVQVDYMRSFAGCDRDAWETEYWERVHQEKSITSQIATSVSDTASFDDWRERWLDYIEDEDHVKGGRA